MKTILVGMNWLALGFALLLVFQSCSVLQKVDKTSNEAISAQKTPEVSKLFIRVYNLEGKKIGKGKIVSISEESIELFRQREYITIPAASIGKIKTKRSGGHNVGIGAAAGGAVVTGLLIGNAISVGTDETWDSGWAAAGVGGAAFTGTLVGGLSALFKNSKTIIIDGDLSRWKILKENWALTKQLTVR